MRAKRYLILALLLGVAIAGGRNTFLDSGARPIVNSIPVPVPVYEIEAWSGQHHASLLNLNLGQPGVPQAPIPVDVDGDYIFDVTVAVNLLDVEGGLPLPIDVNDTIVPNVQIDRLVTAPILGQKNPPLKINIKLTLIDITGQKGPTVIRFGYDTGIGGSIPTSFKAVLGGLNNFFNPLSAAIDTSSGYLGIDPSLEDLGLAPVAGAYRGPLRVIGGLESDAIAANLNLGFDPMPNAMQVDYGHDEQQHIDVAHNTPAEVDFDGIINLTNHLKGDTKTDVDARVERLPKKLGLDIATGTPGQGEVHYAATSDGRLPDVNLKLDRTKDGEKPLHVESLVTALSPTLDVKWQNPEDGPLHVDFAAGGAGVGAVEARVASYDPDSPEADLIPAWEPTEDQYVSVQTGPEGLEGPSLIRARMERVRSATVDHTTDGPLDAVLDIGDGASPLETHVDADFRSTKGGPKVKIDGTVAPLPEQMTIHYEPTPDADATQPLVITYDASRSTDVDATVDIVQPDAADDATCGQPRTICGTVEVRNLSSHLGATVERPSDHETLVALDTAPDDGSGIQPDINVDLTLGGKPDKKPTYITGSILGLPEAADVRILEDDEGKFQRVDLTTSDEIGQIDVRARNWAERPDNLPAPGAIQAEPTWVSAVMRGNLYEVAGHIEHLRNAHFLTLDDLMGGNVSLGDGADLGVHVDMERDKANTFAEAVISPLPKDIAFCLGQAGRAVDANVPPADELLTKTCESDNPYGDGTMATSPIELHYDADVPFDVVGKFNSRRHNTNPGPSDDVVTSATFDLHEVPDRITAAITALDKGAGTPLRVLTDAPGAPNTYGNLTLERTTGTASCNQAAPTGGNATCADVTIESLPPFASVLAQLPEEEGGELKIAFHGCAFDFFGSQTCTQGDDDDQIGSLAAKVRFDRGNPDELPVLDGPDDPNVVHATVALDRNSDDDMGVDADVYVEGVRHLDLVTSDAGTNAQTDIGDGTKPLVANIDADLRDGSEDKRRYVVDATVTPLPPILNFDYVAPGDDLSDQLTHVHLLSNQVADVTGHIEMFNHGASDRCGTDKTMCADLDLERLPFETNLDLRTVTTGPITERHGTTTVDIDAIPHLGQSKPDLKVTATIGPFTLGGNQETPLVIDALLEGIPRRTEVLLTDTERTVSEFTIDPDDKVQGPKGKNRTLDSVEVHACDWHDGLQTCLGQEGQLDNLVATVRNFLFRPADFPPPPAIPANEMAASVTTRGALMDAHVRMTDLKEVRFVSDQDGSLGHKGTLIGARLQAGNGVQPLTVHADLGGLEPGEVTFGSHQYADALLDVLAGAHFSNVPPMLTFCMRASGIEGGDGSGTNMTATCQQDHPFQFGEPGESPLSIAYQAQGPPEQTTIDQIDTTAVVQISDKTNAPEPTHIDGELHVTKMPSALEAHVKTPEVIDEAAGTSTPLLIRFKTNEAPGLAVTARAHLTVGDSVCEDPRENKEAICAGASLTDLPDRFDLFFDPTKGAQQFELAQFDANVDSKVDVTDLSFSQVQPKVGDERRQAIVVSGSITDLPSTLSGFFLEPPHENETPDISLVAGEPITEVALAYRNYVGVDPFREEVPPQRPSVGVNPDEHVFVRQRAKDTNADILVRSLQKIGVRQQRADGGAALDTVVLTAGFGENKNLRAYADLQPGPGDGVDEGGLTNKHLIADVTIENLAANLTVCFRPDHTTDGTPAGESTWCDNPTVPDPENPNPPFSGTLAVEGEHDGAVDLVNIDAFVRLTGPDGEHLAATADLDGIPEKVHAFLPAPKKGLSEEVFDVATYDGENNVAAIGRIKAQAASFDLADVYSDGDAPYAERVRDDHPFGSIPYFGDSQHLALVKVDDDFQISTLLGALGDAPASRLQHLRMAPDPCPVPSNHPDDYPYFPDDISKYQCVRVDFDSADDDPLDLYLVTKKGEKQITFKNGGLTDIPKYIQLTLTDADLYRDDPDTPDVNDYIFRDWCLRASEYEPNENPDCVAPLVRFDQPSNSILHGDLRVLDDVDDEDALEKLKPSDEDFLPDLDATPGADGGGWDDEWADPIGIRFKVLRYDPARADDDNDGVKNEDEDDYVEGKPERLALDAHLRLDLPQSLTVDQPQGWHQNIAQGQGGSHAFEQDASDFRVRIAVRSPGGNAVGSLGRAAGVAILGDGSEVMAGGVGTTGPEGVEDSGVEGFPLPAEFGIAFYKRTNAAVLEDGFIQVDGRVNIPIDMGIRLNKEIKKDQVSVGLRADILNVPAYEAGDKTADPSFRLVAETVKLGPEGQHYDQNRTCRIVSCTQAVIFANVDMEFDFQADPDNPARRIEVFFRQGTFNFNHKWYKKARNGLEIWGFSEVTPSNAENPTRAPIDARIDVSIDPFNVYHHRGVYLLGSLTIDLQSRFDTTLVLDNVEHFWLKQNLLHMEIHSEGPDGGQAFIPGVAMNIDHFSIEVWAILIPLVQMRYIDFDHEVATMWQQCSASDVTGNMIAFNNKKGADQVLWPFFNANQYARLGFGLLVDKLSPWFCISKLTGLKLERPMPNISVPLPGHPVPGTEEDLTSYENESDDELDPAADPPDVPINANTSFCGVLTAGKLTVAAELSGTDCPEDEPLTIVADEIDVLDGGSIVSRANAGPGNSSSGWGGSHGADGGSSPKGDSFDSAFGDATSFAETENGHRGGGGDLGGDGGGRVILHAETITVRDGGFIDVAGLGGQQAPPVECDSDTVDAGGGGAGGGLIMIARSVVVDPGGLVTAAGGEGASGSKGGGGGGGGRVKLQVPNWSGAHVDVTGGSGGTGSCEDSNGGTGSAYDLDANWEQAFSSPMPLGQGYSNGESLQVPYRADVDFDDGDTSYTTHLCYTHVEASALGDEDNDEKQLSDLFIEQMPSEGSITPDDPCGGATEYASATSSEEVVAYDPEADPPVVSYLTPLSDDPLPEGYVGFWTTVVMSGDVVQSLPVGPQLITGIDNTDPVVEITSAEVTGLEGQGDNVELHFTAEDTGGSGLAGVRCSNNDDKWKPCASGNLWNLKGGGGNQTIVVEACDAAGNCAQDSFDLSLPDIAPPAVHMTISEPPADGNGYYRNPPTITLYYDGSQPAANPAFRWAVDGESEKSCEPFVPCVVPFDELDHLLSGSHTFGFTGVDDRGYRWGRAHYMDVNHPTLSETFTVDYHEPTVGFEIVPGVPNGDNSWYVTRPLLVIGGIDDDGGSGIDRLEYRIDGGEWLLYTVGQPVVLPAGDGQQVCVRGFDIAGNVTSVPCEFVAVDDVDPTSSASVEGQVVDGWFVEVPTITLTMSDDLSGVPSDEARFRYRVDNGPYLTCDDGCVVDQALLTGVGHHEVHWSAIDEAGNRPLELDKSIVFQVDTAAPTTRFSISALSPGGLGGWHLRDAQVRLVATDQPFGSGVASTSYTVDNGLITPYENPITLTDGAHEVCAYSADVAGNVEFATCIDVLVDTDDPTAEVSPDAPDGENGWHLDTTFTNGSGNDAAPGSGVDGVFISIDGRPFEPVNPAGDFAIGEGVHDVRVYSVDVAGRKSAVDYQTIYVDQSLPVSRARVFGFIPAANGWWRARPVVVLSAVDGDQNAGIASLEYKLGAADWTPYTGPIEVPEGVVEIQHRSTDKAGLMGPAIRLPLRADLTPAVVKATSSNPSVWIKIGPLLGPANAQLRWDVTENLAESVHAYVIIHDLTGNVVRLLDAGTHDVTPGQVYHGSTAWDGKDQTLLGIVPLGVYYYRVAVVDEAGNWSHSGESAPITIKVKICIPIILPC